MEIWTTFCPSKVYWELTTIKQKGTPPSTNWQSNPSIIQKSLQTLKEHGLMGIRLVIFPEEVTQDGETYNWKPFETMIKFCENLDLKVSLCLGPFQYPFYPAIRLPKKYHAKLSSNLILDSDEEIRAFGIQFLEQQLQIFGNDKRVQGFYIGNEWPDVHNVHGVEGTRVKISSQYMQELLTLIKQMTDKPVSLNTNIDAVRHTLFLSTFCPLLTILGKQGKLGLDVYPSQETWKKSPVIKLRRAFSPYPNSVKKLQHHYHPSKLFFAEVEAQPWGNGRSWYHLISQEPNPTQKVLQYSVTSLPTTMHQYIHPAELNEISLWGADFWLSAEAMGITWPLEQVKEIANTKDSQ